MSDDSVLREQLLEAEMRRETGEISDAEFEDIETDLLARIREIRAGREGGSGPLTMSGAEPIDVTGDARFEVETSITGDFHERSDAPHSTVFTTEPGFREEISVLPGESHGVEPASPSRREPASRRADRSRRAGHARRNTGPRRPSRADRPGSDKLPRS